MTALLRGAPGAPLAARALGAMLALAAFAAHAQPSVEATRTRSLAATCANCHGTDGKAVAGETMVRLAGMPKDYTITQMKAFRDGQRPATVMHQLAKGYSDQQIEAIAAYFAAVK